MRLLPRFMTQNNLKFKKIAFMNNFINFFGLKNIVYKISCK